MSAIGGVLYTDGRQINPALLEAMIAAAPARGLDGSHSWHQGNFGIVRQANATTPEAEGESQPFVGPSGSVVLFDGRLDNRADLLALLGPNGERLREAPDGAIVLALHERMGRDFVPLLAGDYAFAVCEPERRRLALFCSPLGWRPLHWTHDNGRLAFATDMRTLVLGLGLERRLNEGAMAEFLGGRFLTQTETFFSGVFRVEQGSGIFFDGDKVERWLWHDGPFEDWTGRSLEDHVEHFKALFDTALIATCRCNGPVTSQLSGGLDSSTIVCRAAELYKAGRLDRPVGAISARFPGEPHDESLWSMAVEEHCGITAEVAKAQPFSVAAAHQWVRDTWHLPLRPNALDTMAGAINLLGASGRRVMLTGEGGDDWLNGSIAHWPDLLLRGRFGDLFEHGKGYFKDPAPIRMAKTLVMAARPVVMPHYRKALKQPALDWRIPPTSWMRPEFIERTNLLDRWHSTTLRPGLKGFAQPARYVVFSHGNRQLIAQTAMAYAESKGVEVRHPFHDARISSFFMGAAGLHLRDREYRKKVLREAMRGTLPEIVRTRTSKAMFVGHQVDATVNLVRERPFHEMIPVKMGWLDGDRIAALQEPFSRWRREGSSGPVPQTPWGPVWFAIAADMWLQDAFGL